MTQWGLYESTTTCHMSSFVYQIWNSYAKTASLTILDMILVRFYSTLETMAEEIEKFKKSLTYQVV